MPITTAQYVALLDAGKDCLRAFVTLDLAAQRAADEMRRNPDDLKFILSKLIATVGSAVPSRKSQVEIERAELIYTPAKIRRNAKMRDYMRERNGTGTASHTPRDDDHEETEDERNARISREEDELAELQFTARVLDISAPPNADLPIPKPMTASDVFRKLGKEIPKSRGGEPSGEPSGESLP